MTGDRSLLAAAGCFLLAAGATGLALALANSSQLRARAADYAAGLSRELSALQLAPVGPAIAAGQLALCAAALPAAVLAGDAGYLGVAALAVFAPRLWLARARRLHTDRIEAQLDGWLLALSNALRASPSLGDGIEASASLVAAPLARELERVAGEQRLGVPLDQALANMAERIQSPVVAAALAVVRVARNAGGDLHVTLDAAAASLREMARLAGVVRTKTAEGRAQAAVIALAPWGLLPLLDALDPNFLAPLWSTEFGHLLLGVALALWIAALLLARRITAVDI